MPIIDEFLVALGYNIDEQSVQRGDAALGRTRANSAALSRSLEEVSRSLHTLSRGLQDFGGSPTDRMHRSTQLLSADVKQLGLFAITTTSAFALGFAAIAREYQDLYYIQQRTGMTGQQLAGLRFGAPQIGLSSGSLIQQVESFSRQMRDLPTLHQYFANLTGTGPNADPGQIIDRLAQRYRTLIQSHDAMGEAVFRRQIQLGGMDPEVIRQYAANYDVLRAAQDRFDQRARDMGLDYNRSINESVDVTRRLEDIWGHIGQVALKGFDEAYPAADGLLQRFNDLLSANDKLIGSHPGLAMKEEFAMAALGASSLLGVLQKITGLPLLKAGLLGLTGYGAYEGAKEIVSPSLPGTQQHPYGSGWFPGYDPQHGSYGMGSSYLDPANLLRRLTNYGQGGSAWSHVPLTTDWFKGMFSGQPHFAEGGIVQAGVHVGEMVLPRPISQGLQSLFGGGGFGQVLSDLLGGFRSWWSGSPAYAPFVRLAPGSLTGELSQLAGGGGDSMSDLVYPQRTAPPGGRGGGGGGGGGGGSGGSAETGWPGFKGGVPGTGTSSDPRGQLANLRASAERWGLNPDDVVRVARAEGLGARKYATWDKNNWSYGALQGHIGGLASDFQKATGIDPSKSENEAQLNDWLLWYASRHGWGKWTSVTGHRAPVPRRTGPGTAAGWSAPSGGPTNQVSAALGDSIAAGLAEAGRFGERVSRAGYGGSGSLADRDRADFQAVWGRSPEQVLSTLEKMDLSVYRGRTVALSSGASNDPTQLDRIARQIELLQKAGANVELLGVGTGVRDWKNVNERLSQIAASMHAQFTGGGWAKVHPSDYGALLGQVNRTLGTDAARASVTVNHDAGDRTLNQTNNVKIDGGGDHGRVVSELNRASSAWFRNATPTLV